MLGTQTALFLLGLASSFLAGGKKAIIEYMQKIKRASKSILGQINGVSLSPDLCERSHEWSQVRIPVVYLQHFEATLPFLKGEIFWVIMLFLI